MRNSRIADAHDRLTRAVETARARGAQAARLHFHQDESIDATFENARLKNASTEQRIGCDIEVLVAGRRGHASGNDLDALDDLVERAIALGRAGSPAHFDTYPAPAETPSVRTHSPRTADLPRERLIDACGQVVDGLKDYDADLFIEAGGGRWESEGLLVTSGGVCHESRRTGWSLHSHAQRTEDTDMLFAGWSRRGVDVTDQFDPPGILAHILADLRAGRTIAEPPTGRTAALLPPEVFRLLLRGVELGVNGRSVAKNDSPLRGRLGERIFDESLTILDDPHTDFAPGAREIDDCGVPTRRLAIVRDGVLERFLYDLDSAGLAGAEPTGNTACRANSLTVPPGGRTPEELQASLADGIVIKQLIGFGQGNLLNGDFSCNVGLGFRVQDGEIVGRVKNTMIAGNLYELLASGVQLGSDLDPVTRVPSVLIDGVHVSAGGEA